MRFVPPHLIHVTHCKCPDKVMWHWLSKVSQILIVPSYKQDSLHHFQVFLTFYVNLITFVKTFYNETNLKIINIFSIF